MYIQHYLTGLCLFLFLSFNLQSQTQYIGPANGDWFTPANWNNGLPAPGNDALIGGGASVAVNGPLTVNFNLTNYGNIAANAAVVIVSGNTFSSFGPLDISSAGSLTNKGNLQNYGTMTFSGTAGFTNDSGASFANNGPFTLQTTLVNKGSITNNNTIDALTGTLQQEGTFNNNQTLTTKSLTVMTTFTNNFGSVLNITGASPELTVSGSFNNYGTVNNSGFCTVNGSFTNGVSFKNLTGAVLTINAGAQFTNTGGLVENDGAVQVYGTYTNGYQTINRGVWNSFGQFDNNNLFENKAGAEFTLRPGSVLSMGYGSKIDNAGTFDNKNTINSFGAIENSGNFSNNGTITTFSGSRISNFSVFTNKGTISTSDKVFNDGTFENNGTVNVNSGSVWQNRLSFTNSLGASVNVLSDFENKAGATLLNKGTFKNAVRLLNEGSFTNHAYLNNTGNITNETGGTLTNEELFHQEAGNLLNKGSVVNNKKLLSDDCSTISNAGGSINNTGILELKGILFQRGTLTGNPVSNQGGYIHTASTSDAPDICKDGTFGTNIDGKIKVYAHSLIAFENFDSCANIIYHANDLDRPVFQCADVGTVKDINVVLRTTLNDSLTCVAHATMVDKLAPVFSSCPGDIVIFTPNDTASATWIEPTATDNCTVVDLSSTHDPGASFSIGITAVTYTAKDAYDNQNQCQFRVDVRKTAPGSGCGDDSTGPTFTGCPANQSVQATSYLTPVTWLPPTPKDNCMPITMTSSHVSGQAFPEGATTVTYTAKDASGNSSTCSFTVTVTAEDLCLVDSQRPTIWSCPSNIYLVDNPVINGAVALWDIPGASDNCNVASYSGNFEPGTVFPVGTTTITYTATDGVGNTSTCSFNIIVGADPCPGDTSAPAISGCPSNISLLTTGSSAKATWTAPIGSDNCGPVVMNSTHTSGSFFPLGVTRVRYQFSDNKGNTSVCTFTVTVENACAVDNVAPVITGCPSDITVAAGPGGSAQAYWTAPTATDNCALSIFSYAYLPGATFPMGTTMVVYTAIDLKGNSSSCSFNVVVVGAPDCASNASPINGATDVDPASVTLSWNSVSGASSYDVYLGTANPPATVAASNVAGTTTTLTNLASGTTYYWYVQPKNTSGAAGDCTAGTTNFTTSDSPEEDCNKTALFVVGSTYLNASDAAVKERLENLGFAVTVKNHYSAAASDADDKGLVVISSTVSASKVGSKFTNVEVPLINYKAGLFDNLKMTGSKSGTHYGTTNYVNKIVIQATNHPLAAGLSGTNYVFSWGQTVTWGVPASSAVKVGYVPGSSNRCMIFGYEEGSMMVNLEAPARRVGFFLEDKSATALNSNGLALLDAAILWATDCEPCSMTPTAACKNITVELSAIGQPVQITGEQLDDDSAPGCSGTITTYEATPTSFDQPGTYTAVLTVTNSQGFSATCSSIVTVLAPPCNNVTKGGSVAKTCMNGETKLINASLPSGGSGSLEYQWLSGTTDCSPGNMTVVAGAKGLELIVQDVSQTTYFIRYARRVGCTEWKASNCITVEPAECTFFDPNKCYRIVAKHSGKVLKIKNGSNANGQLVQQGAWNESQLDNRWNVINLNNGYYKIVNVQSGKAMDVAGSSMSNGADIIQWPYNGTNNQQWKIISLGNGEYRFEARHSGKALDISGNSQAEGAQAIQWTWHGGNNQRFYIEEVECTSCSKDVLFVVGSTWLGPGDSWVKNRLQQLGYNVTIKSAYAAKSSDANGMGLVIISSTTSSYSVGSKFTYVPVPVLTWESWSLDDLKMTGTWAGYDYSQTVSHTVSILTPSHPLAAGLSGIVQVYTYPTYMRWGATKNPGATRVARIAGDALGIFGYEAGAPMQGGFLAPARRVSFFLDDNTAPCLTAKGAKLFDAAVNWAAQCNGGAYFNDDSVEDRSSEMLEEQASSVNTSTEIAVYPNPASSKVFVNLSSMEGKEVLIRLFDSGGAVRQQWEVNAGKEACELSLSGHAPGYYLLWIMSSDNVQPVVKKIVLDNKM